MEICIEMRDYEKILMISLIFIVLRIIGIRVLYVIIQNMEFVYLCVLQEEIRFVLGKSYNIDEVV